MDEQQLLLLLILMPMLGSIISFFLGMYNEKIRNGFLFIITFLEVYFTYLLYPAVKNGGEIILKIDRIMGTGIFLKLDMYRYVFVLMAVVVWFVTTAYTFIYLVNYHNRNRYYTFFIITLAATVGFFVSENLVNMFTFFEIMTISLYLLIIHDEDDYSHEAGSIYLNMAIFGGLVQLVGIFLTYSYTGTFIISELGVKFAGIGNIKYLISLLVFIGYAVKASCFPLHVWLPKAHPAAPSPASAVLSGVMLKCGVFGIIMVAKDFLNYDHIFSGYLMITGFVNIIFMGVMAMYQRNIKRILAYSSMSQVGYILLGISLIAYEPTTASYATLFYVINHSIYKTLLFLCAGFIYLSVKDVSLNKLRGYGKGKYVFFFIFSTAILGLIAFPGSNGYLGKTLLYSALDSFVVQKGGGIYRGLLALFDFGSAITVAYALKMLRTIFTRVENEYTPKKTHQLIYLPMVLLSVLMIYEGQHPDMLVSFMSLPAKYLGGNPIFSYNFYETHHIVHSISVLILGVLIYALFIKRKLLVTEGEKYIFINPSASWLSFESLVYKPLMNKILYRIPHGIIMLEEHTVQRIKKKGRKIKRFFEIRFKTEDEDSIFNMGNLARRWLSTLSGQMFLAVLATMVIYMILTLI